MLILLVIGAKGGVGATTLSIDLAKRYAQNAATLMVDGDLSGRRSGAALFNCFAALDEHRAVDGFGVAAVGPNLSLLEMASSIHEGFTIKSDRIDEFFAESAHQSQAIVVDSPQPFAAAVRPFAVRATGMII